MAPLLALLAAALQPGGPPPDAADRFVITSTAGTTGPVAVRAIAAGWGVEGVPPGGLVSLRRAGVPVPPWPRAAGVILANGDRLAGTVAGGDRKSLRFTPALAGVEPAAWSVPLSALAAVWVVPPAAALADPFADPVRYPWLAGSKRDALLTLTRDIQRGTLDGFADDPPAARLRPAAGGDAVTVPLARLAAVGLDPALARVRKPKDAYARLVLRDGSRLSLAAASIDGPTLKGTTTWGTEVALRLADLVALDIEQGAAAYLADLTPKSSQVEAYNATAWPWQPNRTVLGGPLTLTTANGVETFDRGLGTHSRTRLRYYAAGYARFEAIVGLDSVEGAKGQVDITIALDGKPTALPQLRGLTANRGGQALSIELAGAKELEVLIDFGAGGDVQDSVNWGDARLIKAAK